MKRAADAAWEYGVVVGWAGHVMVRKNGWPKDASFAYEFVERFAPAVGETVMYRSRLSAFVPELAHVPVLQVYDYVAWHTAVVTSTVPLKVHVTGDRFETFVSSDDELEHGVRPVMPQPALVRRVTPANGVFF